MRFVTFNIAPRLPFNVGFSGRNVGPLSGSSDEPDMRNRLRFNGLSQKCRVCRVLYRGERASDERPEGWDTAGGVHFGLHCVCMSLRNLVGLPRFELGTSCTPSNKY
jgi:hypothetical protein